MVQECVPLFWTTRTQNHYQVSCGLSPVCTVKTSVQRSKLRIRTATRHHINGAVSTTQGRLSYQSSQMRLMSCCTNTGVENLSWNLEYVYNTHNQNVARQSHKSTTIPGRARNMNISCSNLFCSFILLRSSLKI